MAEHISDSIGNEKTPSHYTQATMGIDKICIYL
jgi:hypothetical protein